jgi:hypothetical protein
MNEPMPSRNIGSRLVTSVEGFKWHSLQRTNICISSACCTAANFEEPAITQNKKEVMAINLIQSNVDKRNPTNPSLAHAI